MIRILATAFTRGALWGAVIATFEAWAIDRRYHVVLEPAVFRVELAVGTALWVGLAATGLVLVREARVRLDLATLELDRLATLRARNVVSQQQLDSAQAERDLAEVALERAEDALSDTRLASPYDAVVTRRLADNFVNIAAGVRVVRIQDLSEVRIAINAPEALFAQLDASDVASVAASSPTIPDREFALTYREHSTEIDPVTQTYRTTLAAPRPDDVNILPGMTASVRVVFRDRDAGAGVRTPIGALDAGPEGPRVWVYDETTGAVSPRPVEIGRLAADTAIIASGLAPGEKVVAAGAARLRPGQKVAPLN